MKTKAFLLLLLFPLSGQNVFSQDSRRANCCDVADCRKKTEAYAIRIAGIALFIGESKGDKDQDKLYLDSLKKANPTLYNNFVQAMNEILSFQENTDKTLNRGPCFSATLPEDVKQKVLDWKGYFDANRNPVSLSTEFCRGFRRRIEINQGGTNIFTSKATYLGSIHAFLMYNFGTRDKKTGMKKDCGGHVRFMAGPAGYVRGNTSYLTASSRIAFRLMDIKKTPFSAGNINAFGGYATNFSRFNYATAGLEAELGPIALNLAANFDTRNHYWGFAVGLVLFNNKLIKKS